MASLLKNTRIEQYLIPSLAKMIEDNPNVSMVRTSYPGFSDDVVSMHCIKCPDHHAAHTLRHMDVFGRAGFDELVRFVVEFKEKHMHYSFETPKPSAAEQPDQPALPEGRKFRV